LISLGPLKIAFAKKIALDQLVFAPIAIGCITAVVTLADGKSQKDVENKLKTDYFQILGTNYKVSSPALLIIPRTRSTIVCLVQFSDLAASSMRQFFSGSTRLQSIGDPISCSRMERVLVVEA
jgi:hypothetical protein